MTYAYQASRPNVLRFCGSSEKESMQFNCHRPKLIIFLLATAITTTTLVAWCSG